MNLNELITEVAVVCNAKKHRHPKEPNLWYKSFKDCRMCIYYRNIKHIEYCSWKIEVENIEKEFLEHARMLEKKMGLLNGTSNTG